MKQLEHRYAVKSAQFRRVVGSVLGHPLVAGNCIDSLVNGDQIFPAMLEAIGGARHSITFETYIYWSGEIGRAFAEALSARAGAGVPTHVLVDWAGSQKMDRALLKSMRDAGVEIERYHPLNWYNLDRLNNRTHRKLLVVDGRVGFTGGVGIADNWLGNAEDRDHWRDSHFRLRGPAVSQMQAAFLTNWTEVSGELLDGEAYFPELGEEGEQRAQVVDSPAGDGPEKAYLLYLLSIAAAAESIRLAMAYFVPDEQTEKEMVAAIARGVQIQIIVPGKHMDVPVVRSASRARWGPLLEAGAEIWEYQPTMYHTKVFVVDGVWSSVGSTNFDNRSFKLNDEANLNVYDAEFGRRQTELFNRDLGRSQRMTLAAWRQRSWLERIKEQLALPFSSQL